jgi:hypothetical protein
VLLTPVRHLLQNPGRHGGVAGMSHGVTDCPSECAAGAPAIPQAVQPITEAQPQPGPDRLIFSELRGRHRAEAGGSAESGCVPQSVDRGQLGLPFCALCAPRMAQKGTAPPSRGGLSLCFYSHPGESNPRPTDYESIKHAAGYDISPPYAAGCCSIPQDPARSAGGSGTLGHTPHPKASQLGPCDGCGDALSWTQWVTGGRTVPVVPVDGRPVVAG